MASTLSDDTAPSASLDHLEARAAPTQPRALPEPLGSLPWPQKLASGRPKVEDFSTFNHQVELGPLLTALLLAGRIGGSYAGEVRMITSTAITAPTTTSVTITITTSTTSSFSSTFNHHHHHHHHHHHLHHHLHLLHLHPLIHHLPEQVSMMAATHQLELLSVLGVARLGWTLQPSPSPHPPS